MYNTKPGSQSWMQHVRRKEQLTKERGNEVEVNNQSAKGAGSLDSKAVSLVFNGVSTQHHATQKRQDTAESSLLRG